MSKTISERLKLQASEPIQGRPTWCAWDRPKPSESAKRQALRGEKHMVGHTQSGINRSNLKGSRQPHPGSVNRARTCNILIVEPNAALIGL